MYELKYYSLQQLRSRTEFKFGSALHMKSTGALADSALSPSQQNWIYSHGGTSTTFTLCELCQPSLYDQTRTWHFL
ncbi:F-box only protein 30 [Grus japonensis]|uniref:F-box only protein 30 n=1 Tax=Grus japonensis TaxID=30415 RepID=A0ABC9WQ10_GRUJA